MADDSEQRIKVSEVYNEKGISDFLLAADLENFVDAFKAEGVMKVEHLIDVTRDELQTIGTYSVL